jgi:hypothetical protein
VHNRDIIDQAYTNRLLRREELASLLGISQAALFKKNLPTVEIDHDIEQFRAIRYAPETVWHAADLPPGTPLVPYRRALELLGELRHELARATIPPTTRRAPGRVDRAALATGCAMGGLLVGLFIGLLI